MTGCAQAIAARRRSQAKPLGRKSIRVGALEICESTRPSTITSSDPGSASRRSFPAPSGISGPASRSRLGSSGAFDGWRVLRMDCDVGASSRSSWRRADTIHPKDLRNDGLRRLSKLISRMGRPPSTFRATSWGKPSWSPGRHPRRSLRPLLILAEEVGIPHGVRFRAPAFSGAAWLRLREHQVGCTRTRNSRMSVLCSWAAA